MTDVYLATEESLNREVALKVLTVNIADETFRRSFLAEARLVACLEHQHIIKIYRVGIENEQFYMELELLREGTLKERLEKTRLPIADVLLIIKQIVSALSYAHKKGFVHRDIKPSNIFFRNDNEVVLADFSIATQEDSKGDLTKAGHLEFGTPNYMSPEQAVGELVDGRSDLYSLGIVFYEMLTRRKPFRAATAVATIRQHITAKVPALPPTYAYFQPVLDKALSKAKEDRYANVMSFLDDLMLAEENHANTNQDNDNQDNDKTIAYFPQSANTPTQTQPPIYIGDTRGYTRPWQIPNHKSSEQLVISFIDIKSSTAIAMGDIAYASVCNKFEAIIAENTADVNECALVKMMGDGALIIYADAVYAIQQSLKIQLDVYRHSKQYKDAKFSLRIGLHFGLVNIETMHKIDVYGAHVNKAARIEGCGRSGMVAMSRAVYDIVYPRLKHDIDLFWKDLGKQKLKGVTHKENIYLVSSRKIPIDWSKYKFLFPFILIIFLVLSYLFFVTSEKKNEQIDKFVEETIDAKKATPKKIDILDSTFKRWRILCEDYRVYRDYAGLLQINIMSDSQPKEKIELEKQKNIAEETVISSFATFVNVLAEINNLSNLDSQLETYMSNRNLSSFEKEKFAKAIKEQINVNVDKASKSRGKKIEYCKTICR